MIVFSRDLARRFRALAKKCTSTRRRMPAPLVLCRTASGTLTLEARIEEVGLGFSVPDPVDRNESVTVPISVLESVEGSGDEPVELEAATDGSGVARWSHRGIPRSIPFESSRFEKAQEPFPLPDAWATAPPSFLAALHECGRTAARDASRFALDRVQVRGKKGQVLGTDAKTAFIAGGFSFPFADDLLVPAVPVFGHREWTEVTEIQIGRTEGHLVLRSSPWIVWLPVDATGRFPDVAGVMPRSMNPSLAGIDEQDARALLDLLPDLPGAGDEVRPVTLDLDGTAVVRARDEGTTVEVRLSRSPVAGPPVRVVLDRAILQRTLGLGLYSLRVAGADKPVVFEAPGRTFLAVALDSSLAVPPVENARVIRTDPTGPDSKPILSTRRTAMKPHESNGTPAHERVEPTDTNDPLVEAEGLRVALADAATRAARLVAALKGQRKTKKALESVWTSLKSLNLGA